MDLIYFVIILFFSPTIKCDQVWDSGGGEESCDSTQLWVGFDDSPSTSTVTTLDTARTTSLYTHPEWKTSTESFSKSSSVSTVSMPMHESTTAPPIQHASSSEGLTSTTTVSKDLKTERNTLVTDLKNYDSSKVETTQGTTSQPVVVVDTTLTTIKGTMEESTTASLDNSKSSSTFGGEVKSTYSFTNEISTHERSSNPSTTTTLASTKQMMESTHSSDENGKGIETSSMRGFSELVTEKENTVEADLTTTTSAAPFSTIATTSKPYASSDIHGQDFSTDKESIKVVNPTSTQFREGETSLSPPSLGATTTTIIMSDGTDANSIKSTSYTARTSTGTSSATKSSSLADPSTKNKDFITEQMTNTILPQDTTKLPANEVVIGSTEMSSKADSITTKKFTDMDSSSVVEQSQSITFSSSTLANDLDLKTSILIDASNPLTTKSIVNFKLSRIPVDISTNEGTFSHSSQTLPTTQNRLTEASLSNSKDFSTKSFDDFVLSSEKTVTTGKSDYDSSTLITKIHYSSGTQPINTENMVHDTSKKITMTTFPNQDFTHTVVPITSPKTTAFPTEQFEKTSLQTTTAANDNVTIATNLLTSDKHELQTSEKFTSKPLTLFTTNNNEGTTENSYYSSQTVKTTDYSNSMPFSQNFETNPIVKSSVSTAMSSSSTLEKDDLQSSKIYYSPTPILSKQPSSSTSSLTTTTAITSLNIDSIQTSSSKSISNANSNFKTNQPQTHISSIDPQVKTSGKMNSEITEFATKLIQSSSEKGSQTATTETSSSSDDQIIKETTATNVLENKSNAHSSPSSILDGLQETSSNPINALEEYSKTKSPATGFTKMSDNKLESIPQQSQTSQGIIISSSESYEATTSNNKDVSSFEEVSSSSYSTQSHLNQDERTSKYVKISLDTSSIINERSDFTKASDLDHTASEVPTKAISSVGNHLIEATTIKPMQSSERTLSVENESAKQKYSTGFQTTEFEQQMDTQTTHIPSSEKVLTEAEISSASTHPVKTKSSTLTASNLEGIQTRTSHIEKVSEMAIISTDFLNVNSTPASFPQSSKNLANEKSTVSNIVDTEAPASSSSSSPTYIDQEKESTINDISTGYKSTRVSPTITGKLIDEASQITTAADTSNTYHGSDIVEFTSKQGDISTIRVEQTSGNFEDRQETVSVVDSSLLNEVTTVGNTYDDKMQTYATSIGNINSELKSTPITGSTVTGQNNEYKSSVVEEASVDLTTMKASETNPNVVVSNEPSTVSLKDYSLTKTSAGVPTQIDIKDGRQTTKDSEIQKSTALAADSSIGNIIDVSVTTHTTDKGKITMDDSPNVFGTSLTTIKAVDEALTHTNLPSKVSSQMASTLEDRMTILTSNPTTKVSNPINDVTQLNDDAAGTITKKMAKSTISGGDKNIKSSSFMAQEDQITPANVESSNKVPSMPQSSKTSTSSPTTLNSGTTTTNLLNQNNLKSDSPPTNDELEKTTVSSNEKSEEGKDKDATQSFMQRSFASFYITQTTPSSTTTYGLTKDGGTEKASSKVAENEKRDSTMAAGGHKTTEKSNEQPDTSIPSLTSSDPGSETKPLEADEKTHTSGTSSTSQPTSQQSNQKPEQKPKPPPLPLFRVNVNRFKSYEEWVAYLTIIFGVFAYIIYKIVFDVFYLRSIHPKVRFMCQTLFFGFSFWAGWVIFHYQFMLPNRMYSNWREYEQFI